MTYDDLLQITKSVTASGGTSIGCGVRYVMEKHFNIDGIAIVSDGCENNPPLFAGMYTKLSEKLGKEPPVYLYQLGSKGLFNSELDGSRGRWLVKGLTRRLWNWAIR